MTTFLRFPDEARAIACMGEWYDDGFGWVAPRVGAAIEVLGTLYAPGEYDAAGNELVAPVALPGFHLNVIGEVPAKAAPFLVTPNAPMRVFST